MSLDENLRDLQRHADDFRQRVGFTYTVVDDEDGVVGCVYIYPSRADPDITEVRSWVTANRPTWTPCSTRPWTAGSPPTGRSPTSDTAAASSQTPQALPHLGHVRSVVASATKLSWDRGRPRWAVASVSQAFCTPPSRPRFRRLARSDCHMADLSDISSRRARQSSSWWSRTRSRGRRASPSSARGSRRRARGEDRVERAVQG